MAFPPQTQKTQPGKEYLMHPKPQDEMQDYRAANKLEGKIAVITGGDSGIGRAVAVAFAKEGADIALIYLNEEKDAQKTRELIKKEGRQCMLHAGDIGNEAWCKEEINEIVNRYHRIDILVNNAAEQHPQKSIEDITQEQLEHTFRTNLFSMFFLVKAALPYMKPGSSIINTTSVTAYRGSEQLIDYSASKGAITAFTRSLAKALVDKKIRVNAVAPGPIWTPLIPSTFDKEKVAHFGEDQPMGRAGQPDEVAPSYVFLASDDSSYMTGQVLHPNGGEIING